ncbi:MAG: aryl-sulfate sulfotransferase [Cyanobacteria bacterium HKST-UBA03]|nr:aryl-sulfate sulfotransferase [Cyanobacteria bacterium HKST-UBA03]
MQKPFWFKPAALVLYAGALAFLAYVLGMASGRFEGPGSALIRDTVAYLSAERQKTAFDRDFIKQRFYPARTPASGVLAVQPDKAEPGLTLYATAEDLSAYLVDMAGQPVHQWHIDPNTLTKQPVKAGTHLIFRRVKLLDDGSFMGLYDSKGYHGPYNGMLKYDAQGRLIWHNGSLGFHHDFEIEADGSVLTLTQGFAPRHPSNPVLDRYYIDSRVTVLDASGQHKESVSIIDALLASPYKTLLFDRLAKSDDVFTQRGDLLHVNTVHRITAAEAQWFKPARAGQVLVCLRNLHAVGILDMAQKKMVAVLPDHFSQMHHPQLLPNGHILSFENATHMASYKWKTSVIKEYDPITRQIVWLYQGDAAHPFFSPTHGYQQRLAHGNTLIFESNAGRIFEVTPSGEIVWEYYTPVRYGQNQISLVHAGERVPLSYGRFFKAE